MALITAGKADQATGPAYAEGFDGDFVERRAGLHLAKSRRGDRGYAGIFNTQAYA